MTSWAICSILEIRAQVFLKIWQSRKHLQTPGCLCWFLPIKHSEMLANYLQIASFLINEQIHLWSRLFLPGLLNFSLTRSLSLSRFHFCKWNCPGTEKRFKIFPSVIMPLTTKYHLAKRLCNFLKRKRARWSDKEEKCWVRKCEKCYPLRWSYPEFFALTEALSFSRQTLAVSAEISVTGDRTHLNIFHPGILMWLWERDRETTQLLLHLATTPS